MRLGLLLVYSSLDRGLTSDLAGGDRWISAVGGGAGPAVIQHCRKQVATWGV